MNLENIILSEKKTNKKDIFYESTHMCTAREMNGGCQGLGCGRWELFRAYGVSVREDEKNLVVDGDIVT